MGSSEYRTPPDFFLAVHREYQFTLDSASSDANALLPRYCTKEGFFYQGELVSKNNGLELDWTGRRVWCNPPYARIAPWVAKAMERKAEIAVLLLPNGVDTRWYHSLFENPDRPGGFITLPRERWGQKWLMQTSRSVDVNIMLGRLKFLDESGIEAVQPIDGNMLVVIRGR